MTKYWKLEVDGYAGTALIGPVTEPADEEYIDGLFAQWPGAMIVGDQTGPGEQIDYLKFKPTILDDPDEVLSAQYFIDTPDPLGQGIAGYLEIEFTGTRAEHKAFEQRIFALCESGELGGSYGGLDDELAEWRSEIQATSLAEGLALLDKLEKYT